MKFEMNKKETHHIQVCEIQVKVVPVHKFIALNAYTRKDSTNSVI